MRPGPKPTLRDLEAAPFAQQHVGCGHAYVFEQHFARPVRHTVVTEHGQRTLHIDSRRIARHQNHRLLLVPVRIVRIGLAHEDENLAARIDRAGGIPLAPVDHIVVAVANDRRFDVGRIAGRHPRFRHGKARADFPGEQRCQPFLLLLFRAVTGQHFHVAGIGRRAIERLGSEQGTSHDFAQRRIFEVGQSGAVLRMGQEQIPESGGLALDLDLLDDRGHFHRPDFLGFAEKALLVRINVLVHEGEQALLKIFYFLRVFEIHVPPSLNCACLPGLR